MRSGGHRGGGLHRFGVAVGRVSSRVPGQTDGQDDVGAEAWWKVCDIRICPCSRAAATRTKVRFPIAALLQNRYKESGRLAERAVGIRLPLPPLARPKLAATRLLFRGCSETS